MTITFRQQKPTGSCFKFEVNGRFLINPSSSSVNASIRSFNASIYFTELDHPLSSPCFNEQQNVDNVNNPSQAFRLSIQTNELEKDVTNLSPKLSFTNRKFHNNEAKHVPKLTGLADILDMFPEVPNQDTFCRVTPMNILHKSASEDMLSKVDHSSFPSPKQQKLCPSKKTRPTSSDVMKKPRTHPRRYCDVGHFNFFCSIYKHQEYLTLLPSNKPIRFDSLFTFLSDLISNFYTFLP